MKVEKIQITRNPEKLIERAGRTCYMSQDKITKDSAARFCAALIKSGHESVLEHAVATFRVSGISRALTHQLVRHRIASYSQKSQRYVKEMQFKYVTPPSIRNNAQEVFDTTMKLIQKAYNDLIYYGIKAEDARMVLPNACTTEIVITMNFRGWRHFLKERLSNAAQWEIREMANLIVNELFAAAPSCFEDLIKV